MPKIKGYLEREIRRLKRKDKDAKEIEIQLKQIISGKDNEIARYDRWLMEETEKSWGLSRRLRKQESQVNSLSEENSSLKSELADCKSK